MPSSTTNIQGIARIGSFAILVLLLLYISSIGLRNIFRYNNFKQELAKKKTRLVELENTQQSHMKLLAAMQQDSFWIVESKKKLGYIQKDEIVYKFYKKGNE